MKYYKSFTSYFYLHMFCNKKAFNFTMIMWHAVIYGWPSELVYKFTFSLQIT
jgi:hypothetical protein